MQARHVLSRRLTLLCFALALSGVCRHTLTAQVPGAGPGVKYAVLVGVEVYEHASLRELKYAGDDVTELAASLGKAGYQTIVLTAESGARDVKLLPTKVNIETQLKATLRQCKAADMVVLGFAGHGLQFAGSPDAYFCPQDARPFIDETSSMVSVSGIYAELEKSFAGVKILFVDACRDDPNPSRGRGIDADSAPPPPRGVAALFSCSTGQRAFESDELKHGVFFHHVLRGLEGEAANRAGDVTFDGLSAHVRTQVPVDVARLVPGQRQFPNLKADLVGVPPVLARVTVAPVVKPAPNPNQPPQSNPPSNYVPPQNSAATGGTHPENLPLDITNSIGMKLKLIPAGEFLMGAPADEKGRSEDEGPQHRVKISRPFYLGLHEVTQAQFRAVMGKNPSYYSSTGGGKDLVSGQDRDLAPVECVSWFDCIEYCNLLSTKDGRTAFYTLQVTVRHPVSGSIESAKVGMVQTGNGYRLPSEAQWEYACRGNTTVVEREGANAFGLLNMRSGVWEWCQDGYDAHAYANLEQLTIDPVNMSTLERCVLRGAVWANNVGSSRNAHRSNSPPAHRPSHVGIRVARAL